MARLPYVDPATASPEVRDALERAPALNIFRVMATTHMELDEPVDPAALGRR